MMLKRACGFIPEASFYEGLALVYRDRDVQQDDLYERAVRKALTIMKGMKNGASVKAQANLNDHEHSHGKKHAHSHQIDHGHSHEIGLEMAGLLLNFTEDYDHALENALHEYQIRPNNIEVNKVLATIYLKTGKLEEANNHLKKAQATNCQKADLLCLAGLIGLENGNAKEGINLLRQSFKIDPFQDHILAEEGKRKLELYEGTNA